MSMVVHYNEHFCRRYVLSSLEIILDDLAQIDKRAPCVTIYLQVIVHYKEQPGPIEKS